MTVMFLLMTSASLQAGIMTETFKVLHPVKLKTLSPNLSRTHLYNAFVLKHLPFQGCIRIDFLKLVSFTGISAQNVQVECFFTSESSSKIHASILDIRFFVDNTSRAFV